MTRSKYAIIHPGSHDFTTWFVRSLKAFVNHEWRVLKIAIKIHSANKKVLYERNMHITEGASYQIRKLRPAHAPGIPGTFPRHRLYRKPLVCDPVMHVPWCMSGSLTRGGGETVPGILGACATHNFVYLVRGLLHKHSFPNFLYFKI